MANKTFETYFDERVVLTGAPPPAGDAYLVLREGVVYKTDALGIRGFAVGVDDTDVTTIPAPGTWVSMANIMVLRVNTPNMSYANNVFTYAGIDQSVPSVLRTSMSCIKNQPGFQAYQTTVSINGTPVADHMTVSVNDTERAFVSSEYLYALQQGDTVEMVVRNISGDNDLIIADAQLSIS